METQSYECNPVLAKQETQASKCNLCAKKIIRLKSYLPLELWQVNVMEHVIGIINFKLPFLYKSIHTIDLQKPKQALWHFNIIGHTKGLIDFELPFHTKAFNWFERDKKQVSGFISYTQFRKIYRKCHTLIRKSELYHTSFKEMNWIALCIK